MPLWYRYLYHQRKKALEVKKPINKNVFCSLPFNSVSIAPFGAVRICCNNYNLPQKPDGSFYSFNDSDFDLMTAVNSDFHKELRLDLLNEQQHPSCHRCWDIEKQGGVSYRQSWNDRYQNNFEQYVENMNSDGTLKTIRSDYVELTLGNKCNLKCRMCNPFSSILWLKEAKQLGLIDQSQENDLKNYSWFENPRFEKAVDLLLKSTDRLNILGGEPLIIEEQFNLLKKAIDFGYASKMEVQYNTNLTKIDPRLLEIWSKFKAVFLNVSVDGFENLNEYIRHPMKWKNFYSNLEILQQWTKKINLHVSLHCTFQAINVLQLDRLYKFVNQLNFGFAKVPYVIWVNYPEYHDPRVLPRNLRQIAYERQMAWISSVHASTLNDYEKQWLMVMNSHVENLLFDWPEEKRLLEWARFRDITNSVDKLRKENLGVLVPELKNLL